MKVFLITMSFIFSAESFACVDYKGFRFCVGDKAVAKNSDGTIVGVSANKISIDFTGGSTEKKGIETFGISDVYVQKGCVGELCVGKSVVANNSEGELVGLSHSGAAVNHKKKLDSYSLIKTYKHSDIFISSACLDSYCTGDSAVFKVSDGVIVGINKKERKVAIRFAGGTSKYTGIGSYDLATVAIAKGCWNGFCLGDHSIAGTFEGEVIGLNPYRNQISVLGKLNNRATILTTHSSEVTLRSAGTYAGAGDPKRSIKSLNEFNQLILKKN